ncbi:hypothetical protein AAA799B03_01099 [Marine Group I thaumarchaeote SCGC AAA799-B03]|uniref:Uncharacterized protein n=1 Tax=Marine Group I thaumarchaeote SCGC AAA799-B03 TaxID=1502289 RepID=A0A087S6L3_9ARCH|nr:hypothetical protein AAA799B03_01099 [Marine Group I thaumarchaeote SCGC AAA799-B03]
MNWISFFKNLKKINPDEYYRLLSELELKESAANHVSETTADPPPEKRSSQ